MAVTPAGASTAITTNDPLPAPLPTTTKLAQREPTAAVAPPQAPAPPPVPPRVGDATPKPMTLPVPAPQTSATTPRTAVRAATPSTPADDKPTGTLETFSKRFNIDIAKLPQAEQDALSAAYEKFARVGSTKADSDAFVRMVGRAMTHDRQSVVGPMAEKPEAELLRLAPAISREAALLKAQKAMTFLAHTNAGFGFMQRAILDYGVKDNTIIDMKESDLRDPAVWAKFRKKYMDAAGGEERARADAWHRDESTAPPQSVAMQYVDAMDIVSQRGDDGRTPLQRSTPAALATDVQQQLTDLVRGERGLQAFTPEQIQQMASRLGDVKVTARMNGDTMELGTTITEPSGGLAANIKRNDIPVYPDAYGAMEPFRFASALSVFKAASDASMRGLANADVKLQNGTLTAAELLPLATQVQGAMTDELKACLESGNSIDGVMAGIKVLNQQVTDANQQLKAEKRDKVATAVIGGVAGVGMLLSGPLGWGAGITMGFATVGVGAGIKQAQFDLADYNRQMRAGGIDHAGLVMSQLEEGNFTGLATSLGLNAAGMLGGFGQVAGAVRAGTATERLAQTAARLKYTSQLVDAMSAPVGEQRTAAIAKFLKDTGVTGEHADAIASDLSALTDAKQQVATRLLERFGPEATDPKVLRAVLRFAVANADVNNGAGAVANVDHMYKAYLAMNNIVASQQKLTQLDKTINMLATIGTDAQGKFGYESLAIIPTKVGDRTITTAAEHLLTIRQQAFEDVFRGAPDTPAMREFRARFERDLVNEPDPQQRMKNYGAILGAAKTDSAVWQQVQRNLLAPGLGVRFLPFTEGAYIHNVVDPARIYNMAVEAGLDANDAREAAYRATMHGFGNSFVGGAYPAVPDFAAVKIPGTTEQLFTDKQLLSLRDVGEKSLAWNKELAPPSDLAAKWGISPDLRGANPIFVAAMKANNGELPPGMQEWLTREGAAFRQAKLDAGVGASATRADNLGNYVPEGMRKWAGIFAHNPTMGDEDTIAHQAERLRGGLNGYAIEEATVGDIDAFGANFAGPAERLGFYRKPGAATFSWVMQRGEDGRFVADTSAAARPIVQKAATAVKARFPDVAGNTPAEVLENFFNRKEADMKTALAELAEGDLPPAFDRSRLFTGGADPDFTPIAQLLIFQQTGAMGVRGYKAWGR